MSEASRTAPQEDLAFLNQVQLIAEANFRETRQVPPIAVFDVPAPGPIPEVPTLYVAVIPDLAGNEEDKMVGISRIRHSCVMLESRQVGLILESWKVEPDFKPGNGPNDDESVLVAAGKCEETLFIIVESDRGRTSSVIDILRTENGPVHLERSKRPVFMASTSKDYLGSGSIANFYVPSGMRQSPGVKQWTEAMTSIFGDPRNDDAKRSSVLNPTFH